MSEAFDLAVVGGGIIGAAVAFHSARLGSRVVVLDRSPDAGATDQSSAIARVHQPDMTLAPLSYLGWQEYARWEDMVGRTSTFRRTGCVHDVTPGCAGRAGVDLDAEAAELSALGWRCSVVGAADLETLYPAVAWSPGTVAVFEPDAGFADAATCRRQYLGRVEELGGSVRRGTTAHDVVTSDGAVVGVQTDVEHVAAGAVVLATGGWAAFDSLPPVDLGIRARRIVWQSMDRPVGPVGSLGSLPCYVREGADALYFRPTAEGGVRFGVGCDDWDVAPEVARRDVDDALLERGRDRIAERLGVRPGTTTLISAVDGYTADGRPVIDAWPGTEGLYAAIGFSGGGFKVAPAVGALLARWVATGTADPLLAPYAGSRFMAPGRTLASTRQGGKD